MAEKKKAKKPIVKKPTTKKKKKITVLSGIAHIHASVNNTIVTITDMEGKALTSCSCGKLGYKGSKKSTPFAAGEVATEAAKAAIALGIKNVIVKVNGTGQGKDTAIRSLITAGLEVDEFNDVTPIPHNGCKPQKKPR